MTEKKLTPPRKTEWRIFTNLPCSNRRIPHTQAVSKFGIKLTVSSQRKVRYGIESAIFQLSFQKARVTGGGNHGRIVGGKRSAREENFQAIAFCLCFENCAQLAIRGDTAGNKNGAHALICGGSERAGYQIVHHGVLETRHQIERG